MVDATTEALAAQLAGKAETGQELVPSETPAPLSKELTRLVHAVNGRLHALDRSEQRVEDHREALSLELALAKKLALEAGHVWKQFIKQNFFKPNSDEPYGYSTITEFMRLGKDKTPDEVAVALEDLRKKNREKQKKSRANRKMAAVTSQPMSRDVNGQNKVMLRGARKYAAEVVQVLQTKWARGKVVEHNDSVTITYTRAQWEDLAKEFTKHIQQ
jgi:hypothetical protein